MDSGVRVPVVWSDRALTELRDAGDFIARDSPRYAVAFVRRVRAFAATLSQFAMRGRRVPEYPERELRELIMGNYRLIYMIEPDRVVIVAFIHGARELPPIA